MRFPRWDGDPIRELRGKFFFWDETWTEKYGPYDTLEEAEKALNEYLEKYVC